MIEKILMPKMGESVMEGTIIKWHKNIGESVKKDEILFEISTDKVDTEVPSPVDGILKKIILNENETAEVNTIVAEIETESESESQLPITNAQLEIDNEQFPVNNESTKLTDNQLQSTNVNLPSSNRFYSPVVLNIAQQEGISFEELEKIQGTGIQGRVTKKDILNYIDNRVNLPKNENIQAKSQLQFTDSKFGTTEIPMDNIRKKIMNHMIASRDTSVHVSEMMEVDMTVIHNFINQNREKFQSEGIKLTYMAFISFAVAKALKKFPLMNSSLNGEKIIQKNSVNLGIAVAVEPNGLIVPNIKNAENLNIRGLAKSISELSIKARTKKLSPDDVVDGTFSITNYGVFGALFGTPIINQPEVGILGVGAVVKRVVVLETEFGDQIAIKPMMYLSLSHDHRLVDGMLGGMFLKDVKEILEKFDVKNV